MDVVEDLDREIIIERAKEVRNWLDSLGLSSRSTAALEKELNGIIGNDPGGYIDGHRPLAGLTVTDILAELQRGNGGTVGLVRGVGARVIAELRTVLGSNDREDSGFGKGTSNGAEPDQKLSEAIVKPRRRTRSASAEEKVQAVTTNAQNGDGGDTAKPRRRSQRTTVPDIATSAQSGAEQPQAPTEQATAVGDAPKRRGRPRRAETMPAEPVAAEPQVAALQDTSAPEADMLQLARRRRSQRTDSATDQPQAVATQPVAVQETNAQETVQPKRRGRPRRVESVTSEALQEALGAPGVTESIPRVEISTEAEQLAAETLDFIEPKRRGRPRKAANPDRASRSATSGSLVMGALNRAIAVPKQVAGREASRAPNSSYDPSLERLIQLWSSLHPQGRRAVVLYASTLVFEEIVIE